MADVLSNLKIAGAMLVSPHSVEDRRGSFTRIHDPEREGFTIAHANLSTSHYGVLRGLHYQTGMGKMVRCVDGAIVDVLLDVRRDSLTFGVHERIELTGQLNVGVWVPPGVAHGFQAVSHWAKVLYFTTVPWDPTQEGGVRWDDPYFGIESLWPIAKPILSQKDATWPSWSWE